MPGFFRLRQVNIPTESGWLDGDFQTVAQEIRKTMDDVIRRRVALINEWILALNDFGQRILFGQRSQVGVVLP